MKKRLFGCAALALLSASTSIYAQPKVFATGLLNPAKIIAGPSGTLLVSEFDAQPNSGRVSIISSSGTRRTLLDGLPSGTSTQGPDGTTGLYLDGNTLYVVAGEGDQLQAGTTQGTVVPKATGPSSPILAAILQFDFAVPVDTLNSGFTLKIADHNTLADGNSVILSNDSGDKATASVLAHFRYRTDPVTIYRNSHPYGLAKFTGDANHLYLADAGLNALMQIDLPSGRARKITAFPNQPNKGTAGGPTAEAVPTTIRPYGNQLLVTLFTGFPFATGNSKIMAVDPATGQANVFLDNLTAAIDVAYRTRFFGGVELYVLEYSANNLTAAPGRLRLFNGSNSTDVATNLAAPSAMTLDSTGTKLFITLKGGSILQVDLAQ
jgi:hypothetical protein